MFRDRNQVVLPLNLEKRIPENDPVFKLVEICDQLDYRRLYKEYVRVWRKTNPATLFIILVYAYMKGFYSSRPYRRSLQNRHPIYVDIRGRSGT